MAKILLVPDVPGWAWDRRARSLQKYAPPNYQVDVIYGDSWTKQLASKYDAVLQFSWPSVKELDHPNYWGFVANEGCMHPYHKVTSVDQWLPDERLAVRAASASKNRKTAIERLPRFRGVITINNKPQLTEFLKRTCRRLIYLATGVDVNVFKPTVEPRPDDDRLRIGWCGKPSQGVRFSPKGYHEVFQPLVRRVGYHVDGVWIDWHPNARDHANRLGTDEMVAWYNSLDVLLVTSSVEGTPSVLLEAMACGVPVISTPVGITESVMFSQEEQKQHGLWTVCGYRTAAEAEQTIRSFHSAIKQLAADPDVNRLRGRAARQTMVDWYNWDKLAPKWLEVLVR